MRRLALILGLLFVIIAVSNQLPAGADIVTVTFTNSTGNPSGKFFSVPSNTLAQVTHVFIDNSCCSLAVGINGALATYSLGSTKFTSQNLPVVVGPANIWLTNGDGCTVGLAYFTVQTSPLTNVTNSASLPNSIPSTAVVIPSDTNGPVTIVLESSPDMVTWTPSLPGTYGTTSTNRFFRVRAQR